MKLVTKTMTTFLLDILNHEAMRFGNPPITERDLDPEFIAQMTEFTVSLATLFVEL